MRQGFARSIVALVSIALAGCTTTGHLWMGTTETAEVLPQVRRGDRVLLVRDGQDFSCPVSGIDAEFFYGCREPVLLRDIQEVRIRKRDGESMYTLADLRAGDELTLRMRSGERKRFLLVSVGEGVLRGEDVEVMTSAVDSATVVRNPVKPGAGGVVTAIAGVVTVAGLIILYPIVKGLGNDE